MGTEDGEVTAMNMYKYKERLCFQTIDLMTFAGNKVQAALSRSHPQ